MRGLIDGKGWFELEDYPEATAWVGEPVFSLKDDPEAGSFVEADFEEIEI